MRRIVRGAVLATGVLGFELAIYQLASVGTCASGGPYVIGNECSGSTTGWLLLMFGSIAAIVAAGTVGIPVVRGDEGDHRRRRGFLPIFVFVPPTLECAAFSSLTALVALLGAFAPWSEASSGAQQGTAILAGVLILLGPIGWLGARLLVRFADSRTDR